MVADPLQFFQGKCSGGGKANVRSGRTKGVRHVIDRGVCVGGVYSGKVNRKCSSGKDVAVGG